MISGCTPTPSAFVRRPLVDHVGGDPEGRRAGALAVARLQGVEGAVLDGKLQVLHVAVVLFEPRADLLELVVDRRHEVLQFLDVVGRSEAGHHVLALGV
jgi:hypothetical protein